MLLTSVNKNSWSHNLIYLVRIRLKNGQIINTVLRMDRSSIPKIALRWTSAGKRPRGRQKTTWRNELKSLDLTWEEAEARAKNRAEWRHLVLTLCSDGSEEYRQVGCEDSSQNKFCVPLAWFKRQSFGPDEGPKLKPPVTASVAQ